MIVKKTLNFSKTVRSSEWWDYKLTIIFGTVYATAFLERIELTPLLSLFFFLLAALVPGACYVSVLNDLTDLTEDKLAGKHNRLEGKSTIYIWVLLAVCAAVGTFVGAFLAPTSRVLYLCAWIIFTLYSVPPVRLKRRGVWGVCADALGSHVFPQLFAVSVCAEWFGREIDAAWFGAAAVWSFFLGWRGILWHQLKDNENDQVAGVETFAVRHADSFTRSLVRRLIFPLEIAAFLFMLGYAGSFSAFGFLIFYALLELGRRFLWNIDINLVSAGSRYKLLMDEYYSVLYPIAFIVANLSFSYFSWLILVLHLLVFFRRAYDVCADAAVLLTESVKIGVPAARKFLREFLLGY